MTSSDPYYGNAESYGSQRGSYYDSSYYPDEHSRTREYSTGEYDHQRHANTEQDYQRRTERAEAQRRAEQEEAERERKRVIAARTSSTIVQVLCYLFAVVLALHIILVLGEANAGNGFYQFISDWAGGVSLGFSDLFVPSGQKLRVLLNDGLAAIVWIIIGIVLSTLIRRFVMPVPRSRRTW